MVTTTKIDAVRSLRNFAASARGAEQRWNEKYSDKRHFDKQGFGFVPFNDRGGNAFSVNVSFQAYVGTYGHSSVGTGWSLDDGLARRFFVHALNVHRQAILDTMAQAAEAAAAELIGEARKEVEALRTLLDEASVVEVAA